MGHLFVKLLPFWFAAMAALAEVHVITGEGEASYRVNAWKNIPTTSEEEHKIIVTHYPNVEGGLFFNQKIDRYRIKWNTTPKKKHLRTDKFSNEIIEAYFKPVKYNGRYNVISYEIAFDVSLKTSLYEFKSVDTFPVKADLLGAYESQFLSNARGIGFADAEVIKNRFKKVSKGTTQVAELTFLLAEWVKQNIKLYYKKGVREDIYRTLLLADYRPYFNSEEVLAAKVGTRLGRMNVLIALLRTMGVPVRVVKGLRVDEATYVKGRLANELDITLLSDKGRRFG